MNCSKPATVVGGGVMNRDTSSVVSNAQSAGASVAQSSRSVTRSPASAGSPCRQSVVVMASLNDACNVSVLVGVATVAALLGVAEKGISPLPGPFRENGKRIAPNNVVGIVGIAPHRRCRDDRFPHTTGSWSFAITVRQSTRSHPKSPRRYSTPNMRAPTRRDATACCPRLRCRPCHLGSCPRQRCRRTRRLHNCPTRRCRRTRRPHNCPRRRCRRWPRRNCPDTMSHVSPSQLPQTTLSQASPAQVPPPWC